MLKGEKHLALFYDVVPDGGIPEEIIPERVFAPHVTAGTIKRFSEETVDSTINKIVRYVYFTLPGHEWRASAFIWMKHECLAKRRPFDDAHEYFVGRLLDYTEDDIAHYISHAKEIKKRA